MKVNIVGSGVGGIIEIDVMFVVVFGVIVFGFNVCVDVFVCCVFEVEEIDLCYYSVIYYLIDEVKVVMSGMFVLEFK